MIRINLKKKSNNGITLIALVITIIVLLILAGVSIATLTGDNGILTQANNASIQQSHGTVRDAIGIAYNEYQIEIKTATKSKLASTEIVTIQGEEEKSLAPVYSSFMDFLVQKGYVVDEDSGKIDVEALTGSRQALGNGEDTDVYKIEEVSDKYVVNYYDEDNQKEEIWSVSNNGTNTGTGDITLEPDTGKEALILVYNVEEGDTIELPYRLYWYSDGGNSNTAIFDFDVDWGDGSTTNDITNENIESNATHQYSTAGEKAIRITGKYEVISSYDYPAHVGIEKLIRVEQWGTTGLKSIGLNNLDNLTKIASPTEKSFKELVDVSFYGSEIQGIPENLFANCPNVTNFSSTFGFTAITSIPENLFANCSNVTDFSGTFEFTSITGIPENLFANCPNVTNFKEAFKDTEITSIPENLFANCPNVTDFYKTFSGTKITSIPENLFASVDWNKVESLSKCFAGCGNVTGEVPALWLEGTNSSDNDYQGNPDGFACFFGCIESDNYGEIPEYWKSSFVE